MMIKILPRVIKSITVEPTLMLYTAVFLIVELTSTNLILQKKCRFNATSEPDLNTPCDDEEQGVLLASQVNSSYRLAMNFLCVIFSIFAMCWSDEAGKRRRPLVLLPIIGLILQSFTGIVHSYFWTWNPLNAALWDTVLCIFTGGIPLMTFATQTYLCDVTSAEDRTMRLGIYSAVRTVGDLSEFGSAGIILHNIGFFYTYLVCFVLSIVTLILALVFVKDISIPVTKTGCCVFNVMKIAESFKIVFNKNHRVIVSLLLTIYTLMFFVTLGENSVQYLFLRYKFHWNESDYSFYVIYRYIGVIIGSIFCSIVLSKWLGIHDALIGIFAASWDILAALGYLFASQTWHLYIVPWFDIFHGIALSVSISYFSKYFKSEELGRLSSILAVFSLIIPASFPTYNLIFQSTMNFFPSAYFILSIVISSVVVLLYSVTFVWNEKNPDVKNDNERGTESSVPQGS